MLWTENFIRLLISRARPNLLSIMWRPEMSVTIPSVQPCIRCTCDPLVIRCLVDGYAESLCGRKIPCASVLTVTEFYLCSSALRLMKVLDLSLSLEVMEHPEAENFFHDRPSTRLVYL